jgi:hypothetical protein
MGVSPGLKSNRLVVVWSMVFNLTFNNISVISWAVSISKQNGSLIVLSSFFIWSLCCLSFFDLWILTALLVSSNFYCYLLVSTLKSNIGTAMIIILKSQRIFMKYLRIYKSKNDRQHNDQMKKDERTINDPFCLLI